MIIGAALIALAPAKLKLGLARQPMACILHSLYPAQHFRGPSGFLDNGNRGQVWTISPLLYLRPVGAKKAVY